MQFQKSFSEELEEVKKFIIHYYMLFIIWSTSNYKVKFAIELAEVECLEKI